jgi:cell division protein FtsL
MPTTIEIQFAKRIDNSKVRRDADSLVRLEYVALTLLGAVFVVVALVYGWQQYQWIQYGYRIEDAQKRIEALFEAGQRLRVERSSWASPARIDRTARDLGMVAPTPERFIMVDANELALYSRETQLAQRGK